MKFRKRPVVIDAIQYTGTAESAIACGLVEFHPGMPSMGRGIVTLEGQMLATPGDWIITGVKGERYPCKPEIFDATYELVRELLPCPFCGFHEWFVPIAHMASDSRSRWIVCPSCTTCGSPKPSEGEAVAAWNERTP